MTVNYPEIPEIFRYCRKNSIIVDIDNMLPRGRGKDSPYAPGDEKLRKMYARLSAIDRKEFGNSWLPSCGYVGKNACNRYFHHLFIDKNGDTHPCIGSVNVLLGNAKKNSLKEMWDSREMGIIKAREYDGKCLECELFVEGKCNSCLGRYTERLNNRDLLKTGKVHTTGCWCFKEKQETAGHI
jgi:MoaA/NifB/PqqE/SkfB family radical SAM enzyme